MAKLLLALLLGYMAIVGLVTAFPKLRNLTARKRRRTSFATHPNATYSIILVHGTFASNAQWIDSDSQLSQHISTTLSGPVNFFPLYWSGSNSFEARHEATEKLVTLVNDVKYRHPHAPIIIVGHSHGGSVAVAAREKLPDATLAGVVTLSTPFLHIEYDPPKRMERYAVGGIAFAVAAFLVAFSGIYSQSLSVSPTAEFELITFAILFFLVLVVINVAGQQSRQLGERQARESHVDDRHASRTLILRTSSDEASMVIGIMAVVARITELTHRTFLGFADIVEERFSSWRNNDGAANLRFFAWWTVTMLLITLLMPLTALLAVVARLTVGEVPLLWCRVGAEATPPGKWSIRYVSSVDATPRHDEQSILRHSRLYTDGNALTQITDWILGLSRVGVTDRPGRNANS